MSRVLRAFLQHQEAIKRVLARYVPLEDRNDILQEAFLKAFAAEITTPVHDAKAFLFRVAKNLAITEMTRKSRRETDYLEDLNDSAVLEDQRSGSVEAHIDGKRKLFVLSQTLAHLPEEYQRVFLMRKVEGLRVKQIATRLSVSVSTVEKRLARALVLCDRQLRKQRYDPTEFGVPAITHKRAGTGSIAVAQDGADDEGI
jgi:RNA polymerase sigma-70 factor (ECF subfamily)